MVTALPQVAEISQGLKDFPRKMFAAALKSFAQSNNPLRFNNFAMNLRELSRVMLHDLSPDKDIKACCWFKQEFNDQGKPIITRAQRIRYAVQAGLPGDFVEGTLFIDVQETTKEFNRIVDQLSKFTHVTKETFDIEQDMADQSAEEAIDVFRSLLQVIDDCRTEVHTALEESAREALNYEMIANTVQELDELATHHTVDATHIEHFELTYMGSAKIEFRASGSVDCELQYGSDMDVERDDGFRTSDNFPLTCEFEADITTPLDLKVRNLSVDNSSFYE